MSRMTRMDRLALLDSEVYQELEALTKDATIKTAQSLADKIVQSPTAQQSIRDGIAKALENKADDWEEEHEEIRANIKKLDDHTLFEFCKMFEDEVDERDLDPADYEKEFEEEEQEETEADEEAEEKEMGEVFAYVKASLNHLANTAADSGDTEAAYLIERFIQKIS